jgi:hypothetical protein
MCEGCRSYQSKDFDARPFTDTRNGSMGDDGIALKNNVKFDGDSGQGKKFEGLAPEKADGASTVQYTGRQ